MLEGTDSYFHQPTYILHGLRFPLVVTSKAEEKRWIFKKIGGKVKNFSDPLVHQTVWFCLSFHGILSILLLLTRPYRKDQYLRCQDFLSPNPEEKNYVAMNYDHEKTPKRTQFTHVGTGRIPLLRGIAGVHLVLIRGQFDTGTNLTPESIWHRTNLTPRVQKSQFDTGVNLTPRV